MSTSPERCLGNLIKDIEKEDEPDEWNSKDETEYKSSMEQQFSSKDSSLFSNNFSKLSLDSSGFTPRKFEEESTISFSKKSILSAFNCQKSTKQLQKSLLEIPKETIDSIINELSGMFSDIIKNKNGNYFCSDLLKVCNKDQRIKILKELSPTLSDDCTDEFGSHPIQNLIDLSISEEEYKLLLSSFNDLNKILMASLKQNGSFVIQRLIVHIPENLRKDFNSLFVQLICILSRDMYGVCTVKKFIGCTKNELIMKPILNSILTNFVNISGNQYGNYLIQYLLEKWWNTEEGTFLKKIIVSKFPTLANNHYSSYICDLFLKLCNNEEKKSLLSTLNNYMYIKKNNKFKNRIPLYLNNIISDLKSKDKTNSDKNNK